MQVLVASLLRWLLRHVLTFVLIVVVLLLGRVGWAEWEAWQAARTESGQLATAEREMGGSLQKLANAVNARAAELQTASLARLEAQITAVDSDIAQKRLKRQSLAGLTPMLAGKSIVQTQWQGLEIDGAIGLLQQERAWLQDAKLRLLATQSAQAQRVALERLRQVHAGLYAQWQRVGQERDAMEQESAVKRHVPGTAEYKKIQELNVQRAHLRADNERADADYRRQLALVNSTLALPPQARLALTASEALQPLRARIENLRQIERDNWVAKLWRPVEGVLPSAGLILLGIIFTPIAIKALFYFVLAPLATSRPPVRLLPNSAGLLTLETGASSVSRAITIDSAHEMLVHPEFLQSTGIAAEKTTQWLLNGRFALTSLSAGMAALTRIRCDATETVVISATHNALAEIAVLDLPAGSAVVMQPHNLVGVVQLRNTPLRITAHWRLNSLHAWLTLQLRYLVLHGPARLIVQGCRGVRVEEGTGGRSINQAATIAFSANLHYSTRRCETFVAYLLGKQALLNDSFGHARDAGVGEANGMGFFVYEEMPHGSRKAGVTGRGLEGLTDSLLKVFGI